jgi:hypothetical protein
MPRDADAASPTFFVGIWIKKRSPVQEDKAPLGQEHLSFLSFAFAI